MLESLTDTLKRAVAALEAQRIPYLLGGGLGCWARGGPPSSNDIDLIFEPSGVRISDAVIERGDRLNVAGMQIQVMALDDILVTKLLALDEHSTDYRDLLQIGRSLREQIDWESLRCRTSSSPFAVAFFSLADGLRISASGDVAGRATA